MTGGPSGVYVILRGRMDTGARRTIVTLAANVNHWTRHGFKFYEQRACGSWTEACEWRAQKMTENGWER